MDFAEESDRKRLWDALNFSRNRLAKFRTNRVEVIKQYVGKHYGDCGADEEVPITYLEMAITIYTQQLVGNAPRAYCATMDPDLRSAANELKIALDECAQRIKLEQTMRRVAMDGLFGPGVVKIGTQEPGENGWWDGTAEPWVEWIDLDDLVVDMTAKTWDSVAFVGNRYRLPLRVVQDNEDFDKDVRGKLKATPKSYIDDKGVEKADAIGGGHATDPDEYEDEVELWDVYLPRTRQLVTLAASEEQTKPLRVVKWQGPQCGPYLMFGYLLVPSNLMPLPPVSLWQDLHDLANALYLKLGRQALRQKSVMPVHGGTDEDVERLNETGDGRGFRCDGQPPQEVSYGGPNQVNMGFFLGLNELFNRQSGNLDVLGGLRSEAQTLGQEEMLGAGASQRIIAMRRVLTEFVDQIFEALAFYLYDDPTIDMPLEKRVANSDIRLPFQWSVDKRKGKPEKFKISIEPYSMVYRTPQSQGQSLMQIWQQVIMPAAPALPPQNLLGAIEELLKILAEKLNHPELKQLLPFLVAGNSQPDQEGQQQGSGLPPPGMPPVTTRNYVRTNKSTSGRAQRENALAQAMLGSMPQPTQAAGAVQGIM